jgi:DNA-directed RNA polymerase specialized sigma24 family protein
MGRLDKNTMLVDSQSILYERLLKFNPEKLVQKGCDAKAYLITHIQYAVAKAAEDQIAINKKFGTSKMSKTVNAAYYRLAQKGISHPTPEQLQAELPKVKPGTLREFFRASGSQSIDETRENKKGKDGAPSQAFNRASSPSAESEAMSNIACEEIMEKIDSLPHNQAQAIKLSKIYGLSHGEIAKHLGITHKQSKDSFSIGRKSLQQKLARGNISFLETAQRDKLMEIVKTLSPRQQEAYNLVQIKGLSFKEAGIEMGINGSSVCEHLGRAFKTIKEKIGEQQEQIADDGSANIEQANGKVDEFVDTVIHGISHYKMYSRRWFVENHKQVDPKFVEELDPEWREIYDAVIVGGRKVADVHEELGIKRDCAEGRLGKALRKLAIFMLDKEEYTKLEERRFIWAHVEKLPELYDYLTDDQEEFVKMFYIEKMSILQIAQTKEQGISTAQSFLSYLNEILRKLLKDENFKAERMSAGNNWRIKQKHDKAQAKNTVLQKHKDKME